MKTLDDAIQMTWFFALMLFTFRIDGMGLISVAPWWLVLGTAFLPIYAWAANAIVKLLIQGAIQAWRR